MYIIINNNSYVEEIKSMRDDYIKILRNDAWRIASRMHRGLKKGGRQKQRNETRKIDGVERA